MRRPLPPPEPGVRAVGDLPPVLVVLVLALGAVEGALSLGGAGLLGGPGAVGWRVRAIEAVAVSPAVQDALLAGQWGLAPRYLLHGLVQGGALPALVAGAMLLALGKFVAEAMGSRGMLAALAAGLVAGGLTFGAFAEGTQPLFGAYPGVYGLIGAFTYVLWLRLGAVGANRVGAFRLIAALLAIQLLFGALFGANPQWIGDVGGFVGGLLVAPLAAPGGVRALRARLRGR